MKPIFDPMDVIMRQFTTSFRKKVSNWMCFDNRGIYRLRREYDWFDEIKIF